MRIAKSIQFTELRGIKTLSGLIRYLLAFRKAIADRDRSLAQAINQNDVEIAAIQPSGAPDHPAPVLKLFKNGSTWQLWAYTGATDGWKYVNLT